MAELGKNVRNFPNFAQFTKSLESINDMLLKQSGDTEFSGSPLELGEFALCNLQKSLKWEKLTGSKL